MHAQWPVASLFERASMRIARKQGRPLRGRVMPLRIALKEETDGYRRNIPLPRTRWRIAGIRKFRPFL
ncbi:hypothetical protein D0U02_09280 [Burkholderia pseudomallei]|uniref:Uncharacterized protein n=2 Tax=Burkholderia pseudomallei TaxID=28450 RepID=A0AAX0UDZ6_BURPE|nr:hypothetical protein BURPS1106A_A0808 [Burkholderia pseudomallei 1106a]ARL53891.1 hypothetical protein BOC51_29885 [Burkholderia pseudomallei]EES22764.1 hypothetical protein BURPS1106B_1178 [Burkholderia pseudomallei 1106b]AUL59942.1 hypothetical protein BHT10_30025 [Burkholderia pseudomallei]AYX38709.1 hypothetical protein EGY15_27505 [Burkholderia pseudomallei]